MVLLFVAIIALLPWIVRRVQLHQAKGVADVGVSSRVVSAIAVGPHQRVVTVEVGQSGSPTWLVLGVTAQQINCLHVLTTAAPLASLHEKNSDFAQVIERAVLSDPAAKDAGHA